MRRLVSILIIAALLAITAGFAFAGQEAAPAVRITMLKGTASGLRPGAHAFALKTGDSLTRDMELSVGPKSRVELRFADGTVMRFAEKTRVRMSELKFNSESGSKQVAVGLTSGKIWAKVKKLTTEDSSVEVRTSNAVAGVRGTVYRVNVDEDASALIKVYDGSVNVTNPPLPAGAKGASAAPHEVAGPHAVPPPYHEVSREEWTAIVQAMQQIRISPQGVPSKPESFDPAADADDWVKWNQGRDKEISF
jgi:hypothetical protein